MTVQIVGALFVSVVGVLERRRQTEEDVNVDVEESGRGHGAMKGHQNHEDKRANIHVGDRNKGVNTKRRLPKLYGFETQVTQKGGKGGKDGLFFFKKKRV